ncbi:SLAP domain-containing protein [Paucisalibacillus sp. EB02]|uniref:SLAP domain-containing protein n=1 Tax=Paucisalibacillus sp. EB02 TaxID=1347087 RepID=UPI0005A9A388|nr:SLAP domain-containing protein [Paucisalibacillus sp. EB02]
MQKLVYEPSWGKQISDKDRNLVEKTFAKVSLTRDPVQFTTLRTDRNYKNELLIMVIVHNTTDEEIPFKQKKLCYKHNNKKIAEHIFHLPNLSVEPNTSMPWTFIFPVESYVYVVDIDKGKLELEE